MAGAIVGVLVLSLHGWLTQLYQLPGELVLVIGFANLAYACVSFTLAQLRRGDKVPFLRVVAVANVLWAVVCVILAVVWAGRASVFGLGTLIGEAVFVGCLGVLEWRAAGKAWPATPPTSSTDN
jgi:hypothetical protein